MFQQTGEFPSRCWEVLQSHQGEPVWGQNLVYSFYTYDKTSYPLAFHQYEETDDEDQDNEDETKYNLSREVITELEEEVGIRWYTYLFDSWFAHVSNLVNHVESYGKNWVGPLRSNRQVTYDNKEMRVDTLSGLEGWQGK